MFGVGTQELLVILLAALLLFGGKRIPEIARSLGKAMGDVRRTINEVQREVDLEMLKDSASGDERPRRSEPPSRRRPRTPEREEATGSAPEATSDVPAAPEAPEASEKQRRRDEPAGGPDER